MRNTCASLVVTYTWICRCSNRLFAVSVAFSATRTGRPTFLSGFYANTPTASAGCSRSQTDSGPSVWKKSNDHGLYAFRFLAFQRYCRKTSPRTRTVLNIFKRITKNRGINVSCVFVPTNYVIYSCCVCVFAVVCTVDARPQIKCRSSEINHDWNRCLFTSSAHGDFFRGRGGLQ